MDYLLNGIWNEYGDDRVRDFYLMDGGPLKVISMVLVYLVLVKLIGPKFMENRQPFNIRPIILIYNSLMIGFNGIGFCFAIWITDRFTLTWYVFTHCIPVFFLCCILHLILSVRNCVKKKFATGRCPANSRIRKFDQVPVFQVPVPSSNISIQSYIRSK